ncbi:MAG TPA: hypothetical protein VIJ75_13805 [Hanamia sp.]
MWLGRDGRKPANSLKIAEILPLPVAKIKIVIICTFTVKMIYK